MPNTPSCCWNGTYSYELYSISGARRPVEGGPGGMSGMHGIKAKDASLHSTRVFFVLFRKPLTAEREVFGLRPLRSSRLGLPRQATG